MKKFAIGMATAGMLAAAAIAAIILVPQNAEGAQYATGTLVSCPRSYRVDYVGSDGRRYAFANAGVYYTWYDNFNALRRLSCAEFDAILDSGTFVLARPGARLIQFNDSPSVYALSSGATLRKLENATAARAFYGADWGRYIISQPWQMRMLYAMGTPLTAASQFNRADETTRATDVNTELRARGVLTSNSSAPACTQDTWSCGNWNACNANGTQTRVCNRIYDCPNATTPSPSVSQSCATAPTPTCAQDTWTCGAWNACQPNGTQTRACSLSNDCAAANTPSPAATQTCVYTPPADTRSHDATLRSLIINPPVFSRSQIVADPPPYVDDLTAPANQTFILLTPRKNNPGATVRVNNQILPDGMAFRQTLVVGTNVTTIVVTAEDGQTINRYYVRVVRPSPTAPPACTQDTWTCGNWSACQPNGTQQRTCSMTNDCAAVNTASPATVQSCVYTPPPAPGESNVSSLISAETFNAMFPNRTYPACNGGYFLYSAFIEATRSYPLFAGEGSEEVRKRELAAFLAQISHETTGGWDTAPGGRYAWGLCFREEVGCERGGCAAYCDPYSQYQCVPGKSYHGRGPMQLSWNYNYGPAGNAIGIDLLSNPDIVATNGVVAFKTALWFWMTPQPPKPSAHAVMVGTWQPTEQDTTLGRAPGFGMTTNIINGGLECQMPTDERVRDRVGFFQTYATRFGVSPGDNLYCDRMTHY